MMKNLFLLSMALMLGACSTYGDHGGDYAKMDPFEDFNRGVFSVNEAVDKAVLEPAAKGYRTVTPSGIRIAIRNFLRNLRSPIDLGNQILQGDLEGATNQTARTFINTLAGFGGIVDVADLGGIPYEPEDFGQTLAVWGVDSGPYIVMPILGPSTVRDATGMAVDTFVDPLRLYAFNIDKEGWHYSRAAMGALDKREELLDVIADLRSNSIDYYATLRSAYMQNRDAQIKDLDEDLVVAPVIPDYE